MMELRFRIDNAGSVQQYSGRGRDSSLRVSDPDEFATVFIGATSSKFFEMTRAGRIGCPVKGR